VVSGARSCHERGVVSRVIVSARGAAPRWSSPFAARVVVGRVVVARVVGLWAAALALGVAAPARAVPASPGATPLYVAPKGPPFFVEWPAELQSEVLKVTRGFDGEAYVYVKDLSSGARYEYNAATPAYIASGVKIPFMVALYRRLQERRLDLDEMITYELDDVRDGSPVFGTLKVGTQVPLRVVLDAMIHQSDNAASDLVAKRVGIDFVNQTLADEGLTGFGPLTSLLDVRRLAYGKLSPRATKLSAQEIRSIGAKRTVQERVARFSELVDESFTAADWDRAFREYYRDGWNTATMQGFGMLLERIATGTLLSREASIAMTDVLLGTQTGAARMVAYLPVDVPVAHKTGTQYQRICDLGIFWPEPGRPVVFAACVKGGKKGSSEGVIAKIAKATFELIAPDVEALDVVEEARTSTASPEFTEGLEFGDGGRGAEGGAKPRLRRR
jgi:beta-lactamase class A